VLYINLIVSHGPWVGSVGDLIFLGSAYMTMGIQSSPSPFHFSISSVQLVYSLQLNRFEAQVTHSTDFCPGGDFNTPPLR